MSKTFPKWNSKNSKTFIVIPGIVNRIVNHPPGMIPALCNHYENSSLSISHSFFVLFTFANFIWMITQYFYTFTPIYTYLLITHMLCIHNNCICMYMWYVHMYVQYYVAWQKIIIFFRLYWRPLVAGMICAIMCPWFYCKESTKLSPGLLIFFFAFDLKSHWQAIAKFLVSIKTFCFDFLATLVNIFTNVFICPCI